MSGTADFQIVPSPFRRPCVHLFQTSQRNGECWHTDGTKFTWWGAVITVTLKLRKQDGVIFSIVTFLPEFSFDGFQLGKLMI